MLGLKESTGQFYFQLDLLTVNSTQKEEKGKAYYL